jgi:hypothetical protein
MNIKKKGHFNYDLNLNCDCFYFKRRELGYCNFYNKPLLDFLTPFGKGNKIEGNYKQFIDLIYKKLDMIPDPPEENEEFWLEEETEGFGIIEITINNDENINL